jgi:hypothetical protein
VRFALPVEDVVTALALLEMSGKARKPSGILLRHLQRQRSPTRDRLGTAHDS